MDSQEPAVTIVTWLLNEVGENVQLSYKGCFGGAKFGTGWGQLLHSALTLQKCEPKRCADEYN